MAQSSVRQGPRWFRLQGLTTNEVLLVVTVALACGADAFWITQDQTWSGPRLVVGALAALTSGAGVAALLLGRRRHPVPLAVLGLVLICFINASFERSLLRHPVVLNHVKVTWQVAAIPLWVGLYALAAAHRRTGRALAILASAATLLIAYNFWLVYAPDGLATVLENSVRGVVFHVVAPVVLGLLVKTRGQLIAGLRERQNQLMREQQLLAEHARTAERTRIAREMHGVVSRQVSLMICRAQESRTLATTDSPALAQHATDLGDLGRRALAELRDVLTLLRRSDPPGRGSAEPVSADMLSPPQQVRPPPVEGGARAPDRCTRPPVPSWRARTRAGVPVADVLLALAGAVAAGTAAFRLTRDVRWMPDLRPPVVATLIALTVGAAIGALLLAHRRHPVPLALTAVGLTILYFAPSRLAPDAATPQSDLAWWVVRALLWVGMYALTVSGVSWRHLSPVAAAVAAFDVWLVFDGSQIGASLAQVLTFWGSDVVAPMVLGYSVRHRRPLPAAVLGSTLYFLCYDTFPVPWLFANTFAFPEPRLAAWLLEALFIATLFALAASSRASVRVLGAVSATAVLVEVIGDWYAWSSDALVALLPDIAYNVAFHVLVPVGLGLYLRTRRELAGELGEQAARLEREKHLAAAAAESEERARIAREMHDVVGHGITHMAMHANTLPVLGARSPQAAATTAEMIEQLGRQTLAELHQVLSALQPEASETGGLDDLPALVAQADTAEAPVCLDVHGRIHPVSRVTELAVYRIVQESLTNAHKHAGDAPARVVLRYGAEDLEVVVENDRPSHVSDLPSSQVGLVSMNERAAVLGGRFSAGPTATGGFRVEARLPYAVAA